jgi:hypothetical protein
MLLGNWRIGWLAFEFDPGEGRYSRRFRAAKDSAVCGFGTVERTIEHGNMFFALYRSDRTVVFQAGPQSWALNTGRLRFEHRLRVDTRSSEFSVFQDDRLAFGCSYRHPVRSTMARLDPTYDNIDFEKDYFLGHVGNLVPPLPDRDVWQDAKRSYRWRTNDS